MIIAQTIEKKNVVRSYVDRLILEQLTTLQSVIKVSDLAEKLQSSGVNLDTIRSLLTSNSHCFAYHERRWIPASRLVTQESSVHELILQFVERFGAPVPMYLLVNELGIARGLCNESAENMLRRMAKHDPHFFLTECEEICSAEWAFVLKDEVLDRALELNKVIKENVLALNKNLSQICWKDIDALEEALKICAPVNAKELGAVAAMNLNRDDPRAPLLYDWREFNAKLFGLESYVYMLDGNIYPKSEVNNWIKETAKLAPKITPTIEVEDAAPVEITEEDLKKMTDMLVGTQSSLSATRLLEEFYEVTPSVKTFPDDLNNIVETLKNSKNALWVGGDRFREIDTIPEFIQALPEPFLYKQTEFKNEENEYIDIQISDEGLSSSLRKLLTHPLAMDVCDEDILPATKNLSEQVRLVLKPIHRELGTFPLCQFPTGWLSQEPEVQEFIFRDPSGKELHVWANMKYRLMFNLFDWWFEQPIESGAVFTLTKTNQPNVFEFEWMSQPDPVVHITSQKMEQLRELQGQSEKMSTFDLLREILTYWPKGADFLTIMWELNAVRRSSRHQIASLLSSYQCFYQRSGSPVWHYDAKKVELGIDKTKKKFII